MAPFTTDNGLKGSTMGMESYGPPSTIMMGALRMVKWQDMQQYRTEMAIDILVGWDREKRGGFGTLEYSSGTQYVGHFKNGQLKGYGKTTLNNGYWKGGTWDY